MVEFALCAVGLLLLTVGLFYAAQLLYAYNFVSYAAREGTRWASVRGNQSLQPATAGAVANFVAAEALGLNSNQLTVTTTWTPNENPGSQVTVKVQYKFTLGIPLVTTTSVTVASSSQMVISQ
ncbi:MAG: TadE/TadG family type IV pilus assembly protein [Candidatus Binataceae bacterium]